MMSRAKPNKNMQEDSLILIEQIKKEIDVQLNLEKLLKLHSRLIWVIKKQHCPQLSVEEIAGFFYEALVISVRNYDIEHPNKKQFYSYLIQNTRGTIQKAFNYEFGGVVHLPIMKKETMEVSYIHLDAPLTTNDSGMSSMDMFVAPEDINEDSQFEGLHTLIEEYSLHVKSLKDKEHLLWTMEHYKTGLTMVQVAEKYKTGIAVVRLGIKKCIYAIGKFNKKKKKKS